MNVDVVAQCAKDVSRRSEKAQRMERQLHALLGVSPEDPDGMQRVEDVKALCQGLHYALRDVDGAFRRYELARQATQVPHE